MRSASYFLEQQETTPLCWGQILFTFILAASTVGLAQMPYPQPQIASAQGKSAPDFTLKDQNGANFHLAEQRGGRSLLLVFYRGYW